MGTSTTVNEVRPDRSIRQTDRVLTPPPRTCVYSRYALLRATFSQAFWSGPAELDMTLHRMDSCADGD